MAGRATSEQTNQSPSTPGPVARLVAAALDMVVVVGWAGFAALVSIVLQWRDLLPQTAGGRDILAFVTLVLPVTLTFSVQEAGRRAATPGKRRMNSSVMRTEARHLGIWRSLARNGLKLLPWQIAHTGVFHLAAGSTNPLHLAVAIGAQVLVLTNVAMMLIDRDHRALHDYLAGTIVVADAPGSSYGHSVGAR